MLKLSAREAIKFVGPILFCPSEWLPKRRVVAIRDIKGFDPTAQDADFFLVPMTNLLQTLDTETMEAANCIKLPKLLVDGEKGKESIILKDPLNYQPCSSKEATALAVKKNKREVYRRGLLATQTLERRERV